MKERGCSVTGQHLLSVSDRKMLVIKVSFEVLVEHICPQSGFTASKKCHTQTCRHDSIISAVVAAYVISSKDYFGELCSYCG